MKISSFFLLIFGKKFLLLFSNNSAPLLPFFLSFYFTLFSDFKPSRLECEILETRGNIFKIATEKNLEGGKRLKDFEDKEWPRFPLGPCTAGFIKEAALLLAVDAWLQRRHGAIEPRRKKKKFGPAIVPVLKCPYAPCMNMTMMIPAAWVALFLLVALSYPAMA